MSDTDNDYLATAEAITELAEDGLHYVQGGDPTSAAMVYSVLNQFAQAIAVSATMRATNEIKEQVLPADQLTQEDTGATNPLSDPGQYL